MDANERADHAFALVHKGEAHQALPLVEELVAENYVTAHFLKGMLYTLGGRDFSPDHDQAIACFKRNAEETPCAISFLYVARALLAKGNPDQHAETLEWITLAKEWGNPPETDIAFGLYYEQGSPHIASDYEAAKKHFRTAALRGRVAGFFALARVQRRQHQHLRGALTLVTAWLLLPLWLLVFGKTSRFGV